jgi:hypothetical protein
MARGQGKPKQPGASGDVRDASSNIAGTKGDRGMGPTPIKDRPGPRSSTSGREEPQGAGAPSRRRRERSA